MTIYYNLQSSIQPTLKYDTSLRQPSSCIHFPPPNPLDKQAVLDWYCSVLCCVKGYTLSSSLCECVYIRRACEKLGHPSTPSTGTSEIHFHYYVEDEKDQQEGASYREEEGSCILSSTCKYSHTYYHLPALIRASFLSISPLPFHSSGLFRKREKLVESQHPRISTSVPSRKGLEWLWVGDTSTPRTFCIYIYITPPCPFLCHPSVFAAHRKDSPASLKPDELSPWEPASIKAQQQSHVQAVETGHKAVA